MTRQRDPLAIAFGETVREIRDLRGLSQEQLGADAGLHRNYVGAIERGEINPTLRTMARLASGLRFSLGLLVSRALHRREWQATERTTREAAA